MARGCRDERIPIQYLESLGWDAPSPYRNLIIIVGGNSLSISFQLLISRKGQACTEIQDEQSARFSQVCMCVCVSVQGGGGEGVGVAQHFLTTLKSRPQTSLLQNSTWVSGALPRERQLGSGENLSTGPPCHVHTVISLLLPSPLKA